MIFKDVIKYCFLSQVLETSKKDNFYNGSLDGYTNNRVRNLVKAIKERKSMNYIIRWNSFMPYWSSTPQGHDYWSRISDSLR